MAEGGEDYGSDNDSDVSLSLGSDIGEDSDDGRYKTDQDNLPERCKNIFILIISDSALSCYNNNN